MKKRIVLYAVALALILTGIVLCLLILHSRDGGGNQGEELEQLKDQLKVYTTVAPLEQAKPDESAEAVMAESVEKSETTAPPPLESEEITVTEVPEPPSEVAMTLDFDKLWEVNPDVHAWIEIPGTKVDYPILQSPNNDDRYLTTALDGSYYIGGSLFTQATYNNRDFNDPVTVIYGHTMRAGTLFGQLQTVYTSTDTFERYSEIKLYLPDEVRKYTVFAAVPMEPIHILHTYDFTNSYWYSNFFRRVFDTRAFGANLNTDIIPEPGDRVIILSTCLNEDSTQRFLVMAIHQADIS